MSTTQAPEGSHRATPAGFAPEDWTRRVLRLALEAIEAGASASIVMNVEGLKDNIRALLAVPDPAEAHGDLSDEQIVTHLEAAGIKFQRFIGGISGTKDCWGTAGSQDVRKLAAGIRAIVAASKPQPKGMPAEWLDAFEEWRQTLGAADLDGKRDLVWRHIAGTGFQAGAAWARSQAPAPAPALLGRLGKLKTEMTTYPWSSGSALLLLDGIIADVRATQAPAVAHAPELGNETVTRIITSVWTLSAKRPPSIGKIKLFASLIEAEVRAKLGVSDVPAQGEEGAHG